MKLTNNYGFLKSDLNKLETRLASKIDAEHDVLRETSLQLLRAGGKRIRPVFVLLAGHFGAYQANKEDVLSVASALELIHMATLVHDDVVDDADIRRGKPTVKHVYGNKVAMYTGDYILAKALEEIATVRIPKVHQTLSKALVELVEGEIDQIKDKFNLDQDLRQYLRRTKRKTALLIATSCKLGAIAAGATASEANKLYLYGYNVGMSFQIIDDILDFTASPEELGKPTGSDLLQGNITLPIHFAMQDEAFDKLIRKQFENGSALTEMDVMPILKQLPLTNAIEASYTLSERYLEKALHVIEKLPNTKAKQALVLIANTIGKRRS